MAKQIATVPKQEATMIVVPQPYDVYDDGSVKDGWVLAQLDIAGGIAATKYSHGRVATKALTEGQLITPCFTYDVLRIYTDIVKVGASSMTVQLKMFVDRNLGAGEKNIYLGFATFVYVAIEKPGVKRIIKG